MRNDAKKDLGLRPGLPGDKSVVPLTSLVLFHPCAQEQSLNLSAGSRGDRRRKRGHGKGVRKRAPGRDSVHLLLLHHLFLSSSSRPLKTFSPCALAPRKCDYATNLFLPPFSFSTDSVSSDRGALRGVASSFPVSSRKLGKSPLWKKILVACGTVQLHSSTTTNLRKPQTSSRTIEAVTIPLASGSEVVTSVVSHVAKSLLTSTR
jgi:hypothetical protein